MIPKLKVGMVAEIKNRLGCKRYLVLPSKDGDLILSSYDEYVPLSSYDKDLKMHHRNLSQYDIGKVYHIKGALVIKHIFEDSELELIWSREEEVDWEAVEVDTKVLVRENDDGKWANRYFSHYKEGRFYTFVGGKTSWSSKGNYTPWDQCKLLEGNEELQEEKSHERRLINLGGKK